MKRFGAKIRMVCRLETQSMLRGFGAIKDKRKNLNYYFDPVAAVLLNIARRARASICYRRSNWYG
jgi:hypothetical protein